MVLDTDIHNFYEHLVLREIENQEFAKRFNREEMSDICCLTLNKLPACYIRHDVDMIYFLSDDEREKMELQVAQALQNAVNIIKKTPIRASTAE